MHGLVITYSDLFDQRAPNLDEIIQRIPSKIGLQYLSFLCAELHWDASDKDKQLKLIDGLIRRQSSTVQRTMWSRFEQLSERAPTILLDTFTVMELMNKFLINYNGNEQRDTTPIDEMNVLMAILVVNDKYNDIHQPIQGQNLLETFCTMTWPIHIFSTELRLKKNHFHEVYRGIKFAQHIEESEFLDAFKALHPDSDEPCYIYPSNIFYLYGKVGFNQSTSSFNCMFSFNLEEDNKYTKPWIFDLENNSPTNYKSKDYRTLRSYPILKLYNNSYSMVNWNFILDKMYNGLIFDLFEKSGINNPSSPVYNSRYPDLPGFKSAIAGDFSEQFCAELFNSALKEYIILQGDDTQENNQDLYLRKGKKIALIEHKDPLFTKDSNYEHILSVLNSKLVEDKGVSQIVEHIRKLNANSEFIEADLQLKTNTNQLVVYPILVVSDSAFALTGMEDYLNNCFKEKLEQLGELNFYVHRLVVIDLYSLMNLHDSLALGKKDFFGVIDKFFRIKWKLKKRSRSRLASTSTISAQFQGFSEIIGYKAKPTNPHKNIKGTLKYLMFEELKRLGLPLK